MSSPCYQTQYTDPTTGDVLAQSRWYSPGTGTFRSRDSWAGDLNTPVSLNRYTYAHNNPIRYSDPSGFCVELCNGRLTGATDLHIDRKVIAGSGNGNNGVTIVFVPKDEGFVAPASQMRFEVGEFGTYDKPSTRHDNGHLQRDYGAVPLPLRSPTDEEREYHKVELNRTTVAGLVRFLPFDRIEGAVREHLLLEDDGYPGPQLAWDNAIPAYRHFLEGTGSAREFDLANFFEVDRAGQVVYENALTDIRDVASNVAQQLGQSTNAMPGTTFGFSLTSDVYSVGGSASPGFPYPSSSDWQRTIGGFSMWSASQVSVTVLPNGGAQLHIDSAIFGEDVYNFDPNKAALDSGEPDSLRGRLEQSGLARQFLHVGRVARQQDLIIAGWEG